MVGKLIERTGMDKDKDYSIRQLKGKKGAPTIIKTGVLSGTSNSLRVTPSLLDYFIHPSDDEDVKRRQEIALDLIERLKKRLKPRELEVYEYHFIQGYTQQETAAFMLVTQPYVNKLLRRIIKKAKTLLKSYQF
jgi:DNA-directed RNA polymerase specialized sigma subunit